MKHIDRRIYPHRHQGRFYNYPHEIPEGFLLRSLYIYFKSFINRCFHHPKEVDWYVKSTIVQKSFHPVITWIGHSTFLIQIAGCNILTDPIFGDATSLFPRILRPGIDLTALPSIDYVLISHNHLDHMDAPALHMIKELHPACRYLVPLGDKYWFDRRGFTGVTEYTWWQSDSFKLGAHNIVFTFLPAFHWSQRGIFDKNKSLWGSWMIEVNGKKIYFAGDTAYARHFTAIGREFGNIDYAIMPIGPCEPHKWMKFSHTNAHEAVQGFLELGATHFIPMHWGTFYFGTDTFDTPLRLLQKAWQEKVEQKQLLSEQLHVMRIGQTMTVGDDALIAPADDNIQHTQI